MPLYFFHLKDGEDTLIDSEGTQLAGVGAVPAAAIEQARDIISHEARKGSIDLSQGIDVLDEAGTLVHSLRFADAVEVRH